MLIGEREREAKEAKNNLLWADERRPNRVIRLLRSDGGTSSQGVFTELRNYDQRPFMF